MSQPMAKGFVVTSSAEMTRRDAMDLFKVLEPIYQRGGMTAVLEACRAAQRRIVQHHPHERQNWVV